MYSKKDIVGTAILLLASFAIFRISPIYTPSDSRYEMLFTQRLIWHHSFSLEPQTFRDLKSKDPGQLYQVVQVGERFYYFFPPGSIILSVPYVALANALGISAVDRNGFYDSGGEGQIEKGLAALLMAGLCVIIFFTSRLVLSFNWSLLIAAASAFSTQVWSTASRAMWSHTWGIFLLSVVVWLIFKAEVTTARLRPVLLATCLSWLYFVRPAFASSIIAITLYVLIYRRAIFLPLMATGCVWLVAFIGYSYCYFGQRLPPYYQGGGSNAVTSFYEAFAGSLISPSRGLLIYVPALVFVIYLLVRYRRSSNARLVLLASTAILIELVLISTSSGWRGGHCYGPRLSTDLVPWFALLGILAVEARLKWRNENLMRDSVVRQRTEWILVAVLLLCGATLNGVGAISKDVWRWNLHPDNFDYDSSRVWDWKHPQFLGVPHQSGGIRKQIP